MKMKVRKSPSNKTKKGLQKKTLSIIGGFLVVVLALSFVFLDKKQTILLPGQVNEVQTTGVKNSTVAPCTSADTLNLVKKGTPCTILYSFNKNDKSVTYTVLQSGKYLFIAKSNSRSDRSATVSMIDFASGKVTTLYDKTKIPKSTYNREFSGSGVSTFSIIGDKLYMSIGGDFSSKGSLYVVSLADPTGGLEKLSDKYGMIFITQMGTYYIVHNGYGDTSWTDHYALLNPQTSALQEFLVGGSNNIPGEEKIGDDGKENFIVATVEKSGYENGLPSILPVYTSISYLPLSNTSQRIPLLSASEMPQNIADVKYDKDTNTLYLSGTAFYTFDVATKKLTKISDLSTNDLNRYRIVSVNKDTICLDEWGLSIDDSGKLNSEDIQKFAAEFPSSMTLHLASKSVIANQKNFSCSLVVPSPTPEPTQPVIPSNLLTIPLPQEYIIVGQ